MGAINPFKKPKIPAYTPPVVQAPPPVVAVPTVETSAKDTTAAELADQDRRKTQKGRAATVLSGPSEGVTGTSVAARTLLGG